MSLKEYHKKRSFKNTSEPKGSVSVHRNKSGKQLHFVVQKHQASHLHYDFRLEMKGVLKSWAIPKGPSMNPAEKRLAMHVEDHPFEYKDFEGNIPEGNYGAGTVIIWDQGTYEPAYDTKRENQEKELLKSFYSGSLKIRLKGKKLKGEFALVKAMGRGDNSWLLIKKNDEFANTSDISKKEKSVVSNKTLDQVAENKNSKKWISNRLPGGALKEKNKEVENNDVAAINYDEITKRILASIKKKKKSTQPKNLKPMLATLIDKPFDDPDWLYEVKWDGYRALAYLQKGKADLRSRNNNHFNEKFYPVHNALTQWPVNAIVDGEIVVVNEKGLSQFGDLQNWTSEADGELLFYVFDILWFNGVDLMELPLIERREILRQLVPENDIIKYSENFEATGTDFFEVAQKIGLEGMIAKKADSSYIPDSRSKLWLKIKTEQRHEAIIAGYTNNEDSGKLFSALILGVYEDGELKFIGQAGTGFSDKMQKEILKKLKPLETKKCPFPETPVINKPTRFRPNPPKAKVTWVKPKLVCEVRYQELTKDGIMRHPSFQGMREDKTAAEVKIETAGNALELIDTQKNLQENKRTLPKTEKNRKDFLKPGDENQVVTINGHDLKFSNLSKIYWPKEKVTKRDMLNYYYKVAPYILPYMKDRPQSLNRHPHGITGESFYQKNVAGKVDDWITTHNYKNTSKEGNKTFMVCTDEASLLYIANMGCIEMNPWHSRIQSPDNPDWCVIDLDPDTNSFEQVIEAANVVKKILDSINVPSFPKTSGSTGIHIYIPLGAQYDYDQSKQLAELIVTLVHDEIPGFTSLERSPAKRKGKIYLDFLQNRAIQTIAAPYSLRPKPGVTVSTPLNWEEVKPGLSIKDFTIFNILERLKNKGDIFKGVLGQGINLSNVLKKIDVLL
jgi:bifunctional non-homologous end joining protein LigD